MREMAERKFGRVSAVFWSGDSFKVKRGGEQYANQVPAGGGDGTGAAVCGRVK